MCVRYLRRVSCFANDLNRKKKKRKQADPSECTNDACARACSVLYLSQSNCSSDLLTSRHHEYGAFLMHQSNARTPDEVVRFTNDNSQSDEFEVWLT